MTLLAMLPILADTTELLVYALPIVGSMLLFYGIYLRAMYILLL